MRSQRSLALHAHLPVLLRLAPVLSLMVGSRAALGLVLLLVRIFVLSLYQVSVS